LFDSFENHLPDCASTSQNENTKTIVSDLKYMSSSPLSLLL